MIHIKTNILRAERTKLGLTQKDLARTLEKTVSTYSKKENGFIDFTASEIKILKNLLKLSPNIIDEIFFAD